MMCAARNHVRNGRWLLCITVPAVTDVCRPQPEHSQVARFRFRGQPLQMPQEGQTKPSGQRRSARYCEHASSSEKRASNAWRDIGLSFFHLAGIGGTIPEHYRSASPVAPVSYTHLRAHETVL